MNHQEVRIPKADFFQESVHPKQFSWEFRYLHGIFKESRNNVLIRDLRDDVVQDIVCSVLLTAAKIRDASAGWSKNGILPLEQQIWLDRNYADGRKSVNDWVEKVSSDFGRWFYSSYRFLLKKNAYKLADGELAYFSRQMRDSLMREVREEL